MKATKLTNLVTMAIAVAVVGYFAIQIMVGNGLPAPTIAINVILVQPSISLILFLSAIPMIRYRNALKKLVDAKGARPKPVDSVYAVRSLAFGKSVSLTGSIFVGWQLAILVYQLLLPQGTGILNVVLGLAGALSMTVVGLVVENLFRIPPDREGDEA
jgi:hypothetical protein